MRKKIVAGNWKMNMDHQAGMGLFSEILNIVKDEVKGDQLVVVCPPFIHLHSLSRLAGQQTGVAIGAQNCHQEASGAYTGEISAEMIRSTGAQYVILGHSERRQFFGETDANLAKKVKLVLELDMLPIFCIGETLEERNNNTYFELISRQLKDGLFHLEENEFKRVIIAYEPVWAIGTGLTATPAQAQEIHEFIRKSIAERFSQETAGVISILYGGSCNPKNAAELFSQQDIDGGLIGGASLKSRDFADIVKVFNS